MQRIRPESVLDVGGQQFGVLLLMIQPQHQTLPRLGRHSCLEKLLDPRFNMLAIFKNLLQSGTRE